MHLCLPLGTKVRSRAKWFIYTSQNHTAWHKWQSVPKKKTAKAWKGKGLTRYCLSRAEDLVQSWWVAQGCCKARRVSAVRASDRQESDSKKSHEELQTCCCINPLQPGTLTPCSCKIHLQWTVTRWNLTWCNSVSQDPNTMQLKNTSVLHSDCTQSVISTTFDNLQDAISGDIGGLISNPRFGFKALKRIPSYFSLNFSWENIISTKNYYTYNVLEGKHRCCPWPKTIKHGYSRPKKWATSTSYKE